MLLLDKINQDLKQAMKEKDARALSVLRMLISALNNEAIALKKKEEGLSEEEINRVLKREAKKRKDSIQQFIAGGRAELAEQEKEELKILNKYLPEEMSEGDIKKAVEEVISEMGEVSPSQFGQVMGKVMAKIKSQADGSMVSKVVKEMLNKE